MTQCHPQFALFHQGRCLLLGVLAGLLLGAMPAGAWAQGVDPENRPVASIRVEGLKQVSEQLVRNQIRLQAGQPFSREIVSGDVVRITHLGRFSYVDVRTEQQPDGRLVVTYVVSEQPLLSDVQVVGNRTVSDQDLLSLVLLQSGDPLDQFLIDRGIREIKRRYEREGHFLSDVTIDKKLLSETGILIFRIREGPIVKIRDIRFRGNESFTANEIRQTRPSIQSKEAFPIFSKGALSRETLDADVETVANFYRDRGYLDVNVGREIRLSDDNKDAVIEFIIDEGRLYTVAGISVDGNRLFSAAELQETMELKVGDVFSSTKLRASRDALINRYGKLGYLATNVQVQRLFHQQEPRVDLNVTIDEGVPATVGRVIVRGNELTKDKVILRQLRGMDPGRRFDRGGVATTERRLRESAIFSDAQITILGNDSDETRDVLVEVKEGRSGDIRFGAAVSSDAGLLGAIDLTQRNFDIADPPESFGEFFTGRAFRGAGQYFAIGLQPGSELSSYSVTFREPYLLESSYFLEVSARLFEREREDYDEGRIGGSVSLGQRFGDVWSARLSARADQVDISNIDDQAPVDVFDVAGESVVTALGIGVTRNTTDSRIFPTRGSVLRFGIDRIGALGGDYDFTRGSISYRKFWTVDEDFFGRRTVLIFRSSAGYIFEEGESPTFERFYAGGHRTFRGFRFRGVGPRGLVRSPGADGVLNTGDDTFFQGDDPVGGDWSFLAGLEYNWPIFQDVFRGVVFMDSGTVQEEFGFDEYRVSVGAGIRIRIPFLGSAPFALDFAVPLVKQDFDEERFFSFDLAVPF